MKTTKRSSFLTSLAVVGAFASTALAQNHNFDYPSSFEYRTVQMSREINGFHEDYNDYLRSSRNYPARGHNKSFLQETCRANTLSKTIAEQIRCGATPCKIDSNRKQLNSCFVKMDKMVRNCRVLSPCMEGSYYGIRQDVSRFDQGFTLALNRHNNHDYDNVARSGSSRGNDRYTSSRDRHRYDRRDDRVPSAIRVYGKDLSRYVRSNF